MSGKINIPGNSFSIHVKHHKADQFAEAVLVERRKHADHRTDNHNSW